MQLMGTPTNAELGYVQSETALKYIQELPRHAKQPIAEKFPHLAPLAADLIEKMLSYDPERRITGRIY
jgi:serine/threonine protein kinase